MIKLKQMSRSVLLGVFLIATLIGIQGCYYDKEETLYPVAAECDTLNVSYSATIAIVMNDNCNACHGGPAPFGGVNTDTYVGLKEIADNGKLWGVVNHESGYYPMPKDRAKLSECNLKKIRIWIDDGALNN